MPRDLSVRGHPALRSMHQPPCAEPFIRVRVREARVPRIRSRGAIELVRPNRWPHRRALSSSALRPARCALDHQRCHGGSSRAVRGGQRSSSRRRGWSPWL